MCESECLENPLILEAIFRHLETEVILECRLVSTFWCSIATPFLSGNIWVELSPPFPDLMEQGEFLNCNDLKYGLLLSFCEPAFININESVDAEVLEDIMRIYDQLYKDRYRQSDYDQQVLKYISITGHLVVDLRLELKYFNSSDAEFLACFLRPLINCQSVYINLFDFDPQKFSAMGDNWLPANVTLFGILLHFGLRSTIDGSRQSRGVVDVDSVNVSNCVQFLKGVGSSRSLRIIDFRGWEQQFNRITIPEWRRTFLRAINKICANDLNAFPALDGVRYEIWDDEDFNELMNFPRALREIHIYAIQKSQKAEQSYGFDYSPELQPFLVKHSSTLEIVDLEWGITGGTPLSPMRLPVMKNLKRLDVYCDGSLNRDGWTLENLDYGLKGMLSDVENVDCSSLETLSLFFFKERSLEIWNWIFSQALLKVPIRVLNISLISNCDSPEIVRITEMFPTLRTFRHVRPEIGVFDETGKELLIACEHRGSNRHVMRRWNLAQIKSPYLRYCPFPNRRLRTQLGGGGLFTKLHTRT